MKIEDIIDYLKKQMKLASHGAASYSPVNPSARYMTGKFEAFDQVLHFIENNSNEYKPEN